MKNVTRATEAHDKGTLMVHRIGLLSMLCPICTLHLFIPSALCGILFSPVKHHFFMDPDEVNRPCAKINPFVYSSSFRTQSVHESQRNCSK